VFAHPERRTPLGLKWYAEEFDKTIAAVGITDWIRPFHDMRHTALTNLAATGASPIAVMATAGHRSMQTTKRYLHLAGVTFRDDADALERRRLSTELSTRLSTSEPISDDPTPRETVENASADHARLM
jgi:integrase/recombinase XerD